MSQAAPAAKPEWSTDVEAICYLGTLTETKMAHEISLIGHRMAWLVVSESFMFSAYAVILSSQRVTQTGNWLLWSLPILGIFLIAFVWPSLLQAKKVMGALMQDREKIESKLETVTHLGLTRLGLNRDAHLKHTDVLGALPVYIVPPLLAAAWGLAIIARLHIGDL